MYLRGLNPRTVIQEVVAAVAMGMEMIKGRLLMHPYPHRFRVNLCPRPIIRDTI